MKNLAKRLSLELDVSLGFEIGYSLELESKTSDNMVVKLQPYEFYVREAVNDPLFEKYSVIILDDVQEKDIYFEVLCGLLRIALSKNPSKTKP